LLNIKNEDPLSFSEYTVKGTVVIEEIQQNVSNHRVDRVLGFFSSRPNWDSPTPSHAGESVPLLWFQGGGGGTHSLAGEGVGGPNSDE
jgi:hypothetical protein